MIPGEEITNFRAIAEFTRRDEHALACYGVR